jgi:hypothetical protein
MRSYIFVVPKLYNETHHNPAIFYLYQKTNNMTTEQALTAIGLIGIGGLLKSAFDAFLDLRKIRSGAKNLLKERRYKALLATESP